MLGRECRGRIECNRCGRGQRFLLISLLLVAASVVMPAGATANRVPELVSVGPGSANISDLPFVGGVSQDGRRVWLSIAQPLVNEDADGLCPRGYDYYTGEEYPPSPCIDVYERDRVTKATSLVSTASGVTPGKYDAYFAGATPDGARVYFTTAEPLAPEDTDACPSEYEFQGGPPGCVDVYERFNGTTRLISAGAGTEDQDYDAAFGEVTPAGDRVFFGMEVSIYGQKSYLRSQSNTIPLIGNFAGGSEDRHQILLDTRTNLLPEDHDTCTIQFGHPELGGCLDVYKQNLDTGALEFVSTGPRGNQDYYAASAWDTSSDGRYVFFTTAEPLVPEDTDPECRPHDGWGEFYCVDIYRRDTQAGTTTLISTGPVTTGRDGNGAIDWVNFIHATPDGSRVVFSTRDPLVLEDHDTIDDVYEWADGKTRLISTGTGIDPTGEATSPSSSAAVSRDGRTIVFASQARLLPSDTDDTWDFYELSHDVLKQVTIGPTGGNASIPAYFPYVPGFTDFEKRLFFETTESLVPEDTDALNDIYEWRDGELRLLMPGGVSGFIAGSTPDGRDVFVGTTAQLTPDDGDDTYDIYALTANEPPDCSGVKPSPTGLWPPNSHFKRVSVSGASDPDGDPVTITIDGVSQDEQVGLTADARKAVNPAAVLLRATRAPHGDGRVYRIAFSASDGKDRCNGVVKVEIRRQPNRAAVDSAPPSFDSLTP